MLRARARQLARPVLRGEDENRLQFIEFVLAGEHYALESRFVREVHVLRDLTPLPGTPPFVRGIINVRGQMTAVFDLKEFFGLPPKGLTELSRVLVAQAPNLELGFLADSVVGAKTLLVSQIQSAPPTLDGASADYVRGVTENRLIILDGTKILDDPRLIVNEEVT